MSFDPKEMASKMTAFFMFHGQFVTRSCRINEGSMNLSFTLGGLTDKTDASLCFVD